MKFRKSGILYVSTKGFHRTPSLCVYKTYKTCLLCLFSVIRRSWVNELSPIEISSVKRHNNYLGSRNIRCNRHVINVAKAQKIYLSFRYLFCGIGASEEEYQVDEDGRLIAFENGIYNTTTKKLLPFSTCVYMTFYYHVIYDPCCLDFCLEDLSTDVSRVLKVSYYYCIPVGFSLYIC